MTAALILIATLILAAAAVAISTSENAGTKPGASRATLAAGRAGVPVWKAR